MYSSIVLAGVDVVRRARGTPPTRDGAAASTLPPRLRGDVRHPRVELGSTRGEERRPVGLASGKRATWTSSDRCRARRTRGPARVTFQPAGASKREAWPWTRSTRWVVRAAPPPTPPQPARISDSQQSACLRRKCRGIRRADTRRKDPASMAKTKDKVYDAAGNVKPYVERAMTDEKLRDDVMRRSRPREGALQRARRRPRRRHAGDARRDRRGRPRQAEGRDRRSAQRSRPAPGQEGASRRATRRCCSRGSPSASSSTRSPARRPAAG